MSLAKTDTIDLILLTRDQSALTLVIVATEDLSADGPVIAMLQDKLARYRESIRSGQLGEMFPQYAALSNVIQIDHYTALGHRAEQALTEFAKTLFSDEIRLVSNDCSLSFWRIIGNALRRQPMREWTASLISASSDRQ